MLFELRKKTRVFLEGAIERDQLVRSYRLVSCPEARVRVSLPDRGLRIGLSTTEHALRWQVALHRSCVRRLWQSGATGSLEGSRAAEAGDGVRTGDQASVRKFKTHSYRGHGLKNEVIQDTATGPDCRNVQLELQVVVHRVLHRWNKRGQRDSMGENLA